MNALVTTYTHNNQLTYEQRMQLIVTRVLRLVEAS